jgi:hypothetical protein
MNCLRIGPPAGDRNRTRITGVAHPHHRRAHVILCWLALLLARVAENACAATWPELRRQLDRIQVGTFNGRPFYSALLPAPPYIS